MEIETGPQTTHVGLTDTQVCVPKDWTDDQVLSFAGPSGTTYGWHIRREGDPDLSGSPERIPCAKRKDYVHIMLGC